MIGLLATNTISEGDTREVALDQIISLEWTINRAISSRRWPDEAALEVAYVWLKKGQWNGSFMLDGQLVKGISPYLTESRFSKGNPYKLIANSLRSFLGSKPDGIGFVVEPTEAIALIEKEDRNRDVLFLFLNGDDINSRFDQSPSRWIINFHDWPLQRAETYTDCMKIVLDKVKPQRDLNNRKVRRERWWQFSGRASTLYATVTSMKRVLVIPRVTKYLVYNWEPTDIVYSEAICVIATQLTSEYTFLQSTLHDEWARFYSSSLGSTLRYTPSDCFETFPFPKGTDQLGDIGERYYTHRQSIMLAQDECTQISSLANMLFHLF